MKEYNIISNCCVGARFYEQNNLPFLNPFMWNVITTSDFIKLIKDWGKIDLTYTKYSIVDGKPEEGAQCGECELANGVKLKFIHHIYTPKHITRKVPRGYDHTQYNMAGSDILQYLKRKWDERLLRMGSRKPVFVFFDDSGDGRDGLEEMAKIKTKYKIVVISAKDYSRYNSSTFHYIKKRENDTKDGAKVLAEHINKFPHWYNY